MNGADPYAWRHTVDQGIAVSAIAGDQADPQVGGGQQADTRDDANSGEDSGFTKVSMCICARIRK